MEPHSRPCSSQNGTLRLPQALVLLLRTALAGPTSDRVTQTVTHSTRWGNIKNSTGRLVSFVNPFVVSDRWLTSTFMGMVKLAVICGIGSALWKWSKRDGNGKGKGKAPPSSVDHQHAEAVGKKAPDDLQHVCCITWTHPSGRAIVWNILLTNPR
jgi:hypothetical protein